MRANMSLYFMRGCVEVPLAHKFKLLFKFGA